jgi:hypothetical protein
MCLNNIFRGEDEKNMNKPLLMASKKSLEVCRFFIQGDPSPTRGGVSISSCQKVPTKRFLPKHSCKKSSCEKGSRDPKVPTETFLPKRFPPKRFLEIRAIRFRQKLRHYNTERGEAEATSTLTIGRYNEAVAADAVTEEAVAGLPSDSIPTTNTVKILKI